MIRGIYNFCNRWWSAILTLAILGVIGLCCLATGGCTLMQSRSVYRAQGTVNGQPAEIIIEGVENTATVTPNVGAVVQAAVAGVRGDVAALVEATTKLVNKPVAPLPVLPTKEDFAAAAAAAVKPLADKPPPDDTVQTLLAALAGLLPGAALAWQKAREAQFHKDDAAEAYGRLLPKAGA